MPLPKSRLILIFLAVLVLGVAIYFNFGIVPEPGLMDEPRAVRILRESATRAETYRQIHPTTGYPSDFRSLYPTDDESSQFECGVIASTAVEVCSIRSKNLPAEYVFTYKPSKSPNSNLNDGFSINADALAGLKIIGTRRHFRIDETHTLRVEDSKPADERSPTL
jgi:hypothetical protein